MVDEILTKTGLDGEITSNAHVSYIQVAYDTIKRIGYDKQSNDITQGVGHASDDHLNTGIGDQGLMFGY